MEEFVPNDDVLKDSEPIQPEVIPIPELSRGEIEERIDNGISLLIPKSQEEIRLDRARKEVKDKYPELIIEENREFIERFLSNPKCSICRSFTKQARIFEIKAKIRRENKSLGLPFMLKIYKNSAEKHEDSKGYCCVGLTGSGYVPNRHIKTMIPLPEMSLCSDYDIDPTIQQLCKLIINKITKKENEERLKLEKMRKALKQKEEALKLINDIDEKYSNTDKK